MCQTKHLISRVSKVWECDYDSQVGMRSVNCHAENTSSRTSTHHLQNAKMVTSNFESFARARMWTHLTCAKSSIKSATVGAGLEELLEHLDNALGSGHCWTTESLSWNRSVLPSKLFPATGLAIKRMIRALFRTRSLDLSQRAAPGNTNQLVHIKSQDKISFSDNSLVNLHPKVCPATIWIDGWLSLLRLPPPTFVS